MKVEYGGTSIYEFVGTKSIVYSILAVNNCEKSVCKGHTSNIGHNEFLDVQSNEKVIRHNLKVINRISIKFVLLVLIKHLYQLMMIRDILKLMKYILYHMVTKI